MKGLKSGVNEYLTSIQGLRQGLETGCPKLAIVKFWGVQFSREIIIYLDYNHKHVCF